MEKSERLYPQYVCKACGSTDVRRDAWAEQNPDTGEWELSELFDNAICQTCEGETILIEKPEN